MGSVKDLLILEPPSQNRCGRGRFFFSNRYSVFDWGEMPDHIPDKGASLCLISAYFFEKLEARGVKTHYLGLVEDEKVKPLSDVNERSSGMEIKLLRVIRPERKGDIYDYSAYKKERTNFLIPLEIIYRNSLPLGSSVFKRLREGALRLDELGLKETPAPGRILPKPLLDLSTKLESSDRYLSWNEAKEMTGLTEAEMKEAERIIILVNDLITKATEKVGLTNEDGKIELGFDEQRDLMVLDALGTLDECRFTFEGTPVSKEVARQFYRLTSWFDETEEAKKKDIFRWKDSVKITPPFLPPRLKDLISMMYRACANEITERRWFAATPPLKEIVQGIREFL